jgi:hypothetical protein
MSVQSSPAVRGPSAPSTTQPSDSGTDASFDARWAAWIERGRQHDRAVKRKLRIALLGAAVIGLLVALILGFTGGAR